MKSQIRRYATGFEAVQAQRDAFGDVPQGRFELVPLAGPRPGGQ
jgi:hypothetical protein